MSELATLAYEITAREAAWWVLPVILADFQTGEIVHVSKFAADIFGYEQQELVGKPIEILVPEPLRDVHARYRTDAKVPKTRMMGVGRPLHGCKKDGTLFPAHVLLTACRVMERDIGIAIVVDLTGVMLGAPAASP